MKFDVITELQEWAESQASLNKDAGWEAAFIRVRHKLGLVAMAHAPRRASKRVNAIEKRRTKRGRS